MSLPERDFQKQVTDLAKILGWEWVHFRPAQTAKGWRTPVSGPMGEGWVDLVLIKGARLIFAELKADKGKLSPAQERVLEVLRPLEHEFGPGIEVAVWYPSDLEAIAEILR